MRKDTKLQRVPTSVLLFLSLLLSTTTQALSKTYNVVTDYGAVGDGVADDSFAIQLAINQAQADGGGTIYFPSGTYLLDSTHDDNFGSGITSTHLLIDRPAVKLAGDAAGSMLGSVMLANSTAASAIMIAFTSTPVPVGIIIRDLEVVRSGQLTPTLGASGIRFETLAGGNRWSRHHRIENVRLERHYDGIFVAHDPATNTALVPIDIHLQSVRTEFNYRHGCYFKVGGGRASQCSFTSNGEGIAGSGFRLERPKGGPGTMMFDSCTFTSNTENGLSAHGSALSDDEAIRDLHIVGTQIDRNSKYGLFLVNGQNVNISGSSFTANGDVGIPGVSGARLDSVIRLAMSACSVDGSGANGLTIVDCDTVSISAMTFDWNGQHAINPYNVVINGGQNISMNGLAIRSHIPPSSGPKSHGFWIQGSPENVYITGVLFSEEFGTNPGNPVKFFGPTGQSGSGQIHYWNPATDTVGVFVLPL